MLQSSQDKALQDRQDELDRLLTGPRTTFGTSPSTVDPESGLRPPSWWDGDEDAAQTSMLALTAR